MRCQCIICTDHFDTVSELCCLPCGHTFHEKCLQTWIKNSSTCPTCRIKVKGKDVRQIYLTSLDDTINVADASVLENELSEVRAKSLELRQIIKEHEEKYEDLVENCSKIEKEKNKLKKKLFDAIEQNKVLQAKEKSVGIYIKQVEELSRKNGELQEKVNRNEHIKAVLYGTSAEVEQLVCTYGPGEESVRSIATYCVLMKKAVNEAKSEARAAQKEAKILMRMNAQIKSENAEYERRIESLTNEVNRLNKMHSDTPSDMTNQQIPEGSALKNVEKRISVEVNIETPPMMKNIGGFLSKEIKKDKPTQNIAPPGYHKMKIVSGFSKPLTTKSDPTSSIDDKVSQILKRLKPSDLEDSIVRTGYDGLGGHIKDIQSHKRVKRQ